MKIGFKSIALAGTMLINGLAFASEPQSINVIKFGDANTLFVGDSKSATLYAYTVASGTNPEAQKGYNIHDLSSKISAFAKAGVMDIIVRDMAINPTSKEAYIAFDVKSKTGYVSQIIIVNQAGTIRKFDLYQRLLYISPIMLITIFLFLLD